MTRSSLYPKPVFEIKTARLVIRPFKKSDYKNYIDAVRKSAPQKNVWDSYAESFYGNRTRLDFSKMIDRLRTQWLKDDCYYFPIFSRKTGEFLGDYTVKVFARGPTQWGNIGFTLINTQWGQGYASEGAKAVTQYAFEKLGFHRLEASAVPLNAASLRTIEKIGFEFECVRKGFLKWRSEEYEDARVYFLNRP